MPEESKGSPEMERSSADSTLSRDFARALRSILDSASIMYPITEEVDIRFFVALVGEMRKDEFVNLVRELPVVAEIALDKDLGEKAAILLDVPTASVLASFISSGDFKKKDTLSTGDMSSLREALNPIIDSFSTACDKIAGRPFGSIANIEMLGPYGQKRMVGELSESLYRATVSVRVTSEMTGKMAFVLPSSLAEMLTDTETVSSKPESQSQADMRAYEHIELKTEENASVSAGANAREPSMENIDLILDIQLKLTARLGQVEMPIGEIMKLAPGSVIDIDRLADEPIELVVNDRPIARGEIVVVQENFGVRITEIISPKDRIKSLR
jgi:flagellar motor switch protein FliN/FliY